MAQQNRERGEIKQLTDDPTGHDDIGGPEVPGTGTGGGTGTTGSADDAGGMGADLTDEPGHGDDESDERMGDETSGGTGGTRE
jgi:hypothetical protein